MLKQIYKSRYCSVYEQPPTKRTIIVNNIPKFLSFPYLIFVISKGDPIRIFASNEPIKNLESNVKIFYLPNTDMNGRVCLGDDIMHLTDIEIINKFWFTSFTEFHHLSRNSSCNCSECQDRIKSISNVHKLLNGENPLSIRWLNAGKLLNFIW